MDHAGIARPFGWIRSIEILDDVWLAEPTTVEFSRCNMFMGPNDSGKSLFLSLLSGLSQPSQIMQRVAYPNSSVHAAINWYDPQPRTAAIKAAGRNLDFTLDGLSVPFIAQPYQVISTPRPFGIFACGLLSEVASELGRDPWNVRQTLLNVPQIVDGAVKEISVRDDFIHAVVTLNGHEYRYEGSNERRIDPVVAVELLIALAETCAQARPTILLLDGVLDSLHPQGFDHLSGLLGSSARSFQTIAVSMMPRILKNPDWTVTYFIVDQDNSCRTDGRCGWARLVQEEAPLEAYEAWREASKRQAAEVLGTLREQNYSQGLWDWRLF
ncbi:hypothetical protein OHA27_23850 [Streptomyces sp. NBC_01619]|uniref:hypothetical protein n=1 Tax=Streptomyces sp. NBC_01619 TaxID=2975901 RepID=UPI002254FD41|nr:hypothetical protein [Streptomyces sp. NBC_01619]MCX4513296.1 hypothetical protein [Streptomyces sp. NBC_01619]